MSLFKKRAKVLSPRQAHFAGRIAERILSGQRKAADYLNRKTAGMSRRGMLLLLVGFCLVFGAYCFYLLVRAFH